MEEQREFEGEQSVNIYVIQPFSGTNDEHTEDYWDEHYKHFIEDSINDITSDNDLLSEYDWSINKSSVQRGGPLNYEIVWDLFVSNIVIADITDLNENVLYELGIRHALSGSVGINRTIIIQDEDCWDLPFDFTNYAVLGYNKNRMDTWKTDLEGRLMKCLQNPNYRDNPVAMTFAQRGVLLSIANQQQAQLAQAEQAMELVDTMVNDIGLDKEWVQNFLTASIASQNTDLAAEFGETGIKDFFDSGGGEPNEKSD